MSWHINFTRETEGDNLVYQNAYVYVQAALSTLSNEATAPATDTDRWGYWKRRERDRGKEEGE